MLNYMSDVKANLPVDMLLLFSALPESSATDNASSLELQSMVDLTELYTQSINKKSGIKFLITTNQEEIIHKTSSLPVNPSSSNNVLTIPIIEKSTETGYVDTLTTKKHIRLYSECEYAEKIVMLGFPIGQYILNINGCNTRTAKRYGQYYIIDLTLINFKRIDTISIICNSTEEFKIGLGISICVVGKHCIYDTLLHGYVRCPLESTIIKLYDNHIRYQYLIRNNASSQVTIKMRVNGYITSDLFIIEPNEFGLIRFETELNNYFNGSQNIYLSDEINQSSLNMSRVDWCDLCIENLAGNDTKIEVVSSGYMQYKALHQLFSN